MLWYIIDGWNVINKIGELKKATFPCHELISYIRKYRLTGSSNNRVTIIFDGRLNSLGEFRQDSTFRIIFSGEETADDLIKREVKAYKNKKQVVVVSDDRGIRDCIKLLGANSLSVGEFVKKRDKKKAPSYKEKNIDRFTQKQITEELKKIWLEEL